MRGKQRTRRLEAADERLEAAFGTLREECSEPPPAPGFLAGFRARRDDWLERGAQAAVWRVLALRLAPAGALAALVAVALAPGVASAPAPSDAATAEQAAVEYEDPFATGLEEVGVAAAAMTDDEAGYELVAVLYEPWRAP